MAKSIYVNLAVKDLKKSMAFFSKLGFKFNPTFTDKNAACMVIGKNIYAMLLVEKFFVGFTKRKIMNAHKSTEVLLAIEVSSRKTVSDMVSKAIKAGGKVYRKAEDHGWMYASSFCDLDGHQWEPLYMDMKKLPKK